MPSNLGNKIYTRARRSIRRAARWFIFDGWVKP